MCDIWICLFSPSLQKQWSGRWSRQLVRLRLTVCRLMLPCWLSVRVPETLLSPLLSWSWGAFLTTLPSGFSCSRPAIFADWTAGAFALTPGEGQLIHWLPTSPEWEWWCLSLATRNDEWSPCRGEGLGTGRKVTCLWSGLWSLWRPFVFGLFVLQGKEIRPDLSFALYASLRSWYAVIIKRNAIYVWGF